MEVAIDGEDWRPARLGRVPNEDTWVQWALTVDVEPGDHTARVRAIGRDGEVQTGVERDVRARRRDRLAHHRLHGRRMTQMTRHGGTRRP